MGAVQAKHEDHSLPSSPLPSLQGDGIPLGKGLSPCCPCLSNSKDMAHLAFSLGGIGTGGAGVDGDSPAKGFFPLNSGLENQSLSKDK